MKKKINFLKKKINRKFKRTVEFHNKRKEEGK